MAVSLPPQRQLFGRVIAEYGVNTLGKKKWAIVHSTDAFGTAGGKALASALEKLGNPSVLDQGYANQSQDFTPVVLAVKQSGADVLGSYFTFENDLGIFARQLRQLGVNIPWVGSPSVVAVSSTKLAGPALFGTYGVADYAEESSEASKAFGKAYREAYKTAPDNQSAWPYDAVTILSAAINKAGSTDPGKIREAIARHQEDPWRRGRIQFRSEWRWSARLQCREERKGHHRLRQAYRLQRLVAPPAPFEGAGIILSRSLGSGRILRPPVPETLQAESLGAPGCKLVPMMSALMDLALQLLFTGVGIGAVYALVALGFVLIFRATNVVNFAQGEFSMVAAYLMVVFAVDLGWPYWLSFLLALAGMALLGAIFNLGVYYPLRHRTFLPVIIATIGASILLANSVLAIYGPQPQVLEGWFETPGIQLGPVYLDSQYLLIIAVTMILVVFNYWFFEHTMLGKKLQATSQDKEMASLLGISVSTMIMITFIYSAVLGGLAGILVAPVLFVSIQMGSTIALKAFAATIIGGFGDVAGAIIGGLALGIIETFGAAYISVPYKDGFAFLVLVLFLMFRPQGIFGERVAEKA